MFNSFIKSYQILRWAFLVLLGLLIYGQTFRYGFVFDDYMFVVNNPFIKDFRHVSLIWHSFPMTRSVGFYSFALNYYFNQYDPRGYHIFNFIVHLIAVGLVWGLSDLLFRITKSLPSEDPLTKELPFIIAVLFLVHPCQTQAVSYISQRFESMACVFYLGTVFCYLKARTSTVTMHKIILFGLSALLTLLGIFTKEVVITLPAMVLASEWILLPDKDKGKVYIALFLGGIFLFALFTKLLHTGLSIFLQSTPSQSHDGDVISPIGYFLTQMRVLLTFFRLLVLPIHQNLDYDYQASVGLFHPPLTLVGLCLLGFIIFFIIRLRRSVPLIAFGLAWILITFSINLAPRANVIFEHKLYLISFGFFLTTVVLLSHLVHDRKTLLRIICGIVMILAIVSYQRNKVWKDVFTLWGDAVQKSPHKARPYGNLGTAYYNQGSYAQAIFDFNKAIAINPYYTEAYNNRGASYYDQGNSIQAMSDYNKAIETNPYYEKAYCNRGVIYEDRGNFKKAMDDFNKAIKLNPYFTESYTNRGVLYGKEGDFPKAMSDFNKAISLDPKYPQAYGDRGLAYYRQGKIVQALSDYNKAIELNPENSEVYSNRGVIYNKQGMFTQAIFDFNKAIEISPKNALAYGNRGKIYLLKGRLDHAISDYNKAILLNPDYVNAYNNRAIIYFQLKQYDKAWEDVRKAQDLGAVVNPGFIQALKAALGQIK